MKKAIGVVAIVLGLSACTNTPNDARLAAACEAYTATLNSLASVKAELSDEQQKNVDRVRAVVNPVCLEGKNINSYSDAIITVSQGLSTLAKIEQESN